MADSAVGKRAICDGCGVEFTIKPSKYVRERKPSDWITVAVISLLFGSIFIGYIVSSLKPDKVAQPVVSEPPVQQEAPKEKTFLEVASVSPAPVTATGQTVTVTNTYAPPSRIKDTPNMFEKDLVAMQIVASKAFAELTQGLSSIDFGALTMSQLCLAGEQSFPVAFSKADDIACAAGTIGKGRVIVIGNTDAAEITVDDTSAPNFILNAVTWAGASKTAPIISNIKHDALFRALKSAGIESSVKPPSKLDPNLPAVYICSETSGFSAKDCASILEFVSRGGGLILCESPQGINSSATAANPFNRISAQAGIYFTGSFTGSTFPTQQGTSMLFNFNAALKALDDDVTLTANHQRIMCDTIQFAAKFFRNSRILHDVLTRKSKASGWIQVSEKKPLVPAERPVDAMLARYQSENILKRASPLNTPVHPSSADWPGQVKTISNGKDKNIRVDGNSTGTRTESMSSVDHTIRMTGIYAAPGATLTVSIPRNMTTAGLRLRIGVHNSINYDTQKWLRYPDVTTEHELTGPTTKAANSFGGLVSILVPAGSTLGDFDISISGGIGAPYFAEDRTSNADWLSYGRTLPGAWGFFENESVIIIAPSAELVKIENPAAVLRHWSQVISHMDELAGVTAERSRPEILISDRQISSAPGSGYPVTLQSARGDIFFDRQTASKGNWQCYKILGQAYLDRLDDIDSLCGEPEIESAWFAAYAFDKLHNRPGLELTEWPDSCMEPASRLKAVGEWLALPAPERTWENACAINPAAYDCFWQIKDAFGWELFTGVNNLLSTEREDEVIKLSSRDRWILLASRNSQRNLIPFFESRGMKNFSPYIRKAVKDMTPWIGNSAPSPLKDAKLSIEEDLPRGTMIHKFSSIDKDPANRLLYEISEGNANESFVIDRTTGELRVNRLDYEIINSYELSVKVSDNAVPPISQKAKLRIKVENVREQPKVKNQTFVLSDNEKFGALVGRVSAIPDDESKATFEIADQSIPNAIAINANSGELFKGNIRFQPGDVYKLQVRVSNSKDKTQMSTSNVCMFFGLRSGVNCEYWAPDVKGSPSEPAELPPPVKKDKRISIDKAVVEKGPFLCRISGWIVPPEDNEYRFWISSDGYSRMKLAPGPRPINTSDICECESARGPDSFDLSPNQRSAPIRLEAGVCYYFEIYYRSGGKHSHLDVAWKMQGKPREIIPSALITPELP